MAKEKEVRSQGEVREVNEDGTFSGYLTVWDTVDSYNSTFARGAFKKTLEERGHKIKILYDHTDLIGSAITIREDDHGLYGEGRLNLDVPKAKEAYAFMKDGTLEGLSFMFRTIKEGFDSGVRIIKEAQLFEFGPVVFPANDEALITDVRSEDFNESLEDEKLYEEKWVLMEALRVTLSDIWWSNESSSDNVVGKLDKGLMDFHAAYLDFAARWVAKYWVEDGYRNNPFGNALANTFASELRERNQTITELAANTSLTLDEAKQLRSGELLADRSKLKLFSKGLQESHREQRNEAVETLCCELRDMLTNSEKKRITALLTPSPEKRKDKPDLGGTLNYFKTLNKEPSPTTKGDGENA